MIEVFKTNVQRTTDAKMLVGEIHQAFPGCKANFDLQDCDNILRVKAVSQSIDPSCFTRLLARFGFEATILPDTVPAASISPSGKIKLFTMLPQQMPVK